MERADLPAAEEPRIAGEAIHHSGRHGNAGQDGQRAEDKDDRKIGDLLQRVVAIESVGLRRQVKSGVVDPGIPCLQQHECAIVEPIAATAPYRTA